MILVWKHPLLLVVGMQYNNLILWIFWKKDWCKIDEVVFWSCAELNIACAFFFFSSDTMNRRSIFCIWNKTNVLWISLARWFREKTKSVHWRVLNNTILTEITSTQTNNVYVCQYIARYQISICILFSHLYLFVFWTTKCDFQILISIAVVLYFLRSTIKTTLIFWLFWFKTNEKYF